MQVNNLNINGSKNGGIVGGERDRT